MQTDKTDLSSHDAIKARLYLQAVIPALCMLTHLDEEAQTLARKWSRQFQITINGEASLSLIPTNGKLNWSPDLQPGPAAALWFPDNTQFLKLMEQRGLPLVFPVAGWLAPQHFLLFDKLMRRLEPFLKPVDPASVSEHELATRVHLQLAVATASVAVLGSMDPACMHELKALPNGTATFQCGPDLPPAWVNVSCGSCSSGIGEAPEPAAVKVQFKDAHTGYGAMSGTLDQLAAVGACRIRVQGLVPLADGLDFIMNRVKHYLPTT